MQFTIEELKLIRDALRAQRRRYEDRAASAEFGEGKIAVGRFSMGAVRCDDLLRKVAAEVDDPAEPRRPQQPVSGPRDTGRSV